MVKATSVLGVGVALVFLVTLQGALGSEKRCGPRLLLSLELVCKGGLGGFMIKRMDPNLEDENSIGNDEDDGFENSLDLFPFLGNEEANSLTKTRRRRFGIVHECCDRPCSISELRTYCRPNFS